MSDNLTPLEYRRVAAQMTKLEDEYPKQIAALRMLLFTGARLSEITKLRWDEVQPPRLQLFDSKTNAKMIYLDRQCEAVLTTVPSDRSSPYVFVTLRGEKPINPDPVWSKVTTARSSPMSGCMISGTALPQPALWTACRWRPSASCSASGHYSIDSTTVRAHVSAAGGAVGQRS